MSDSFGRRRFGLLVGTGVVGGFAGCLGDENDGTNGADDDSTSTGDDEGTDDGVSSDEGGEGGEDGEGSDGLVYAFAPDRIGIIDPESGELVDEITDGIDGAEWGDPQLTRDDGRIFVAEQTRAQLLAIDTDSRSVAGRVDIGLDPVHVYNPVEGEIWAHSDDEGAFYVVDADELEVLEVVEAGLEGDGHGKLLAHEALGERAYAANVNDPAALEIDLAERERTGYVELGEGGGTHYKAYAPETGYAYFERSGLGTTAVVDTASDEFVDELEFAGGMYLSPDGERLAVLDGETIHVVDATSEESEVLGYVEVEGEPAVLRYYEEDDGSLFGFTANGSSPDISALDLESYEEVDRLEAGESGGRHRSGVAGGGYFFTASDVEGTVTVVEMAAQDVVAQVDVEEGVDTLQYVGDSGTGYTGRRR